VGLAPAQPDLSTLWRQPDESHRNGRDYIQDLDGRQGHQSVSPLSGSSTIERVRAGWSWERSAALELGLAVAYSCQ